MNKDILRVAFKPLTVINKIVKKQDIIFFYSNLGFRDNVKSFYDYLIENEYNKKYKIVVSINDYEDYEKDGPDNVLFVGNKAGIKYFMKSKYAFYCFGKYPIKPAPTQTVVNLWHGMPLKRIGNMESGLEKIDYNFFTKIISTADIFNPIMEKSFNCSKDQVVVLGQPRNDEMFKENKKMDRLIRKDAKKVIVWLPTYRDEQQGIPLPGFDIDMLNELNSFLEKRNCRLIVKIHPLQQFDSELGEMSGVVFMTQEMLNKNGMTVYSLLRAADALITDYSSVFFDYMLLDRPMAFTIDDIEKYQSERGFSFENPLSYMPGPHIRGVGEVEEFIDNVVNETDNYKEERKRVNNLVNYYKDGNSSERIAKEFIK